MKRSPQYLLIVISSLALLVLLLIQVNWIVRTARIKEELFSEKANMVLARTAEALSSDEQACRKLDAGVEATEIRKIDSLFRYYLDFYNLHMGYTFQVIKPDPFGVRKSASGNVYNKRLSEVVSRNGLELKLVFPDKKEFILAEMGSLFLTSVLLILVVLVLFWRAVLSLLKQRQLLLHTTDFLNNMTHEFKTPLTNIALAGRMIARDAKRRADLKTSGYSEIILAENNKLRQQVEQVLGMSALEGGGINLNYAPLAMHVLLADVVSGSRLQFESLGVQIELLLEAECDTVNGDPTHLGNVFSNLFDNAIKYSVGIPHIRIHTYNRDHQWVAVLSDRGIGIPQQYHQRVFDKFFRVPAGDLHNVKGFGIGLAYVRRIVECHGGNVALDSIPGKGTHITIQLPYV